VNNRPSELSGGQRQRVAIARALVNNPAIIFADEPCANLDSKSGDEVMEILVKLNEAGNTIVMVTHHAYHYRMTKRIVRMKDGTIVEDKPNTPVSLAEAKGGAPGHAPAPAVPQAVFAGYQAPPPPLPRAVARAGMVCPKCATDNRQIAKFCRACGFTLQMTPSMTQELRLRLAGADLQCGACGASNRPIAKFCRSCGKPTINASLAAGAPYR
jgi:energy-coupling factor transporter ATP-binding protein EcfA2